MCSPFSEARPAPPEPLPAAAFASRPPAMAAPAFAAAPHAHRDAHVETVEANGVIQKIIVVCGCGERIEVHCAY
ncbi:MAG: hypothetical protein QM796_19740 [Chthoniobacteraceae bacterium]